jgi:hypothetical protein
MPLTSQFALDFAREWIAAWNAHDLAYILSHYADDFEMSSPVIVQLVGEPSGVLRGKPAVGAYWALALERIPDLHFELEHVYGGVNSVTIGYRGPRGLGAEVFWFNPEGKVQRAAAHYAIEGLPAGTAKG